MFISFISKVKILQQNNESKFSAFALIFHFTTLHFYYILASIRRAPSLCYMSLHWLYSGQGKQIINEETHKLGVILHKFELNMLKNELFW